MKTITDVILSFFHYCILVEIRQMICPFRSWISKLRGGTSRLEVGHEIMGFESDVINGCDLGEELRRG